MANATDPVPEVRKPSILTFENMKIVLMIFVSLIRLIKDFARRI